MLGPISSFFNAVSGRFPAGAATLVEASAASRTIAAFASPTVGRTFEDRTASVLNRLEGIPRERGPLSENFGWMARASRADERAFYSEATHHIDRLLQLEPWNDGENTLFEYTAYQALEAILRHRDIASFVFFLGVMGGEGRERSLGPLESLESMMKHEKMGAYFGLVAGVFPAAEKSFDYDAAARTVLDLDLFGPVRPEILRFLSTAVLKRAGRLPMAGAMSGVYFDSARHLADAFGYGLAHSELGPRVSEAIRIAAVHPFGFLKMNRLAHLLMRREFEGKVAEFVPETPGLLRRLFVKDGYAEAIAGIEACLRAPASKANVPGSLKGILKASPVPQAKRLAAALGVNVFFQSHGDEEFLDLVEESNRPHAGHVEAIYFFPKGVKGRALIDARKSSPYEEAVVALHEFVHIGQERRNGQDWAHRHLLEAEREALAVETWFRLTYGDRRLYDVLAGLSPQGFEAGLVIAVEQLYLRLKELPS